MPAVDTNSNKKVVVTGANGLLAMWVVRVLLDQDFAVRGTVRTEDKGSKMKQFFSTYGDKFEWIVVKDITVEGVFDEAVEDVDPVMHSASPIITNSDDPEAFIRPADDGTLSILNSILKYGKKIKRVIMTSSMGAMLLVMTGPTVVDENSWGDSMVQLVQGLGNAAPQVTKYWASKTLSERAAWDIYEKHKAESGWELVVLNPSIVIGKLLQEFETAAQAPLSLQVWYNNIVEETDEEVFSAGDIIFSLKPEYYSSGILPRENPEVQSILVLTTNTTKARDILGLQYKTLEVTIESTLAAYEARGLIRKK